jgi:hypothetical protein
VSGPDIFISYSRQERPAARLFAESFAEEGFSVWWDAVLHSGETFDEVIERQLRAAKAVVVLWSPRSVASRWVRAEATQADRANKLVPVVIEPCDRPIIFELTHTAELPHWKGDREDPHWQGLVNDLRRLIGSKVEAEPVVAAPRAAPVPEPEPAPAPKAPESVEEMKRAAEPERPEPEAVEAKGAEHEPVKYKKHPLAKDPEALARALERLAQPRNPALQEPTPAEAAQARFFKQSDEFRENEGELVHCLRKVHADGTVAYHPVSPSGLKIGRTRPADLVISEPSVSREHCLVELAADKLRVQDLNSTNGTYIDNKRVRAAEILPVGSVLRVGNVSLEHEVITRGELMQRSDMLGFDTGTRPPEPRIARS